MDVSLKYTDDSDKCYGVTGMAIGIVALDGESLLESLSLDAEPGDSVKFSSEYYFSGNPRLSARIAWNQILKHFQLSAAMTISNVLCRSYVGHHAPLTDKIKSAMFECIAQEGRDSCSLDDDEIKALFTKNFNYLHRLFSHHGVQSIADDFARTLSDRRQLSRVEVIEQLQALSML